MTPKWLTWSRDDAEGYARGVGLDAEVFGAVVASAQGGDRAAKIRLSAELLAPIEPSTTAQAEGGGDPAPGPRALEALIEPLRTEITREPQTALSIVPELAALADRVLEAGITPVELRAVREAATELLRDAGVRGAHDLVREALRPAPSPKRDDKVQQGRALDLEDPEPWPESVDGAELLDEVAATFARYLVLPVDGEAVLALWVVHSYALAAAEHTPYLALVSPTKRCGKSTALTLARTLARRPLGADNVSPASIYRVIELHAPTLLIDELDRVAPDSDIWSILNSGHARGGCVLRVVGDVHEPRAFGTFGPKLIAYIRPARSPVPPTVEDRSIRIVLLRQRRSERRARLRSRELEQLAAPIRQRLMRWSSDHIEDLAAARPIVPQELDHRAADGWEPLLAIADAVGGRWPDLARRLAIAYSADRQEDEREAVGVLLLVDLGERIREGTLTPDQHGYAGVEMTRLLHGLADRPWARWGRRDPRPLTEHALARLLRPHGVRSRSYSGRVRRYPPDDLHDAIERVDTPPMTLPTKRHSVIGPNSAPVSDSAVRAGRYDASEASSGGDDGSVRGREPGEDDGDSTPTGWPLDEVDL